MMRRVPIIRNKVVRFLLATGLSAIALGGCGASEASQKPAASLPTEFVPACGHPGTTVEVGSVPVTVRHADCDLTGVTVTPRGGGGGAVVPARGEGVGNSSGLTVSVDATTGDVSINSS